MRIAFISDVHANEAALVAALDRIAALAVDRIIFAGDAVGLGPSPNECIERLRNISGLIAVRGNVDRKVGKLYQKKRKKLEQKVREAPRKAANKAWTALTLTPSSARWLDGLPEQARFEAEGFRFLIVHGSPLSDLDYIYASITPEALAVKLRFEMDLPDVLVSGHAHVPFVRKVDKTLVINCGSGGRPVDGDPRGSFVVGEFRSGREPSAEVIRFEYPIDELRKTTEASSAPMGGMAVYELGVRSTKRFPPTVIPPDVGHS